MRRLSPGLIALLALLVLTALHIAWLATLLPETVVSHWGPAGPNNWTSRTNLLLSYAVVNVGIAALFVVPGWCLERIPTSLINLPHKEYWLAPEQKAETARLANKLLAEIAAATLLFCLVVFHDVAAGNLPAGEIPRMPGSFWMWLLAYLAYVGVWIARLVRTFGKPD